VSAREANKLLSAFVAEVDEGRAPEAPARLTLGSVADEWLETKGDAATRCDERTARVVSPN
jgi:hypothetical protein